MGILAEFATKMNVVSTQVDIYRNWSYCIHPEKAAALTGFLHHDGVVELAADQPLGVECLAQQAQNKTRFKLKEQVSLHEVEPLKAERFQARVKLAPLSSERPGSS